MAQVNFKKNVIRDEMPSHNTDGWIINEMREHHDEVMAHGLVKTQYDMTAEERRKIEEHYGCKINMSRDEGRVKREPIDSYILAHTYWDKVRRRREAREAREAKFLRARDVQLSA